MKKDLLYKNVQDRLLLLYCLLIFLITGLLSVYSWRVYSTALKNNAEEFVSAEMSQMQLNIDNYFDRIEGTAALLFSDENFYIYDKTSDKYDDYTRLKIEDEIKEKIVDLGIMENFADFCIVYSDNTSVGWLSGATKNLYKEEGLYNKAINSISNERKSNGWFYSVNDENENLDRIFYVKKYNDNAVILVSIYCRELESVFNISEDISGITIRLADSSNNIIYSSDSAEAGQMLDGNLVKLIESNGDQSYVDNDLINVNTCSNGWRVVTVVPNDVITGDISNLKYSSLTFTVVMAAIFIIAGILAFIKLIRPVDTMVNDLEEKASHDGLTNILNKRAFEQKVTEDLDYTINSCSVAYVMMDVDHFKTINDTLGHAYGDQFIVRTAKVLKNVLPQTVILGRIGGDEFSFWIKDADKSVEEMKEYMTEILDNLSREFLTEFKEEHEKYNVSLSAGITVLSYKNETFKDLYKTSDTALYNSKENGRNQFTFYKEDKA